MLEPLSVRLLAVFLLLFGVVFTFRDSLAQSTGLFSVPWRAYDVADYPHFAPLAAAYGDVDADGDIDAVAAREYWFSPGIAVLLNRGDGSFGAEALYHLGSSMSVGDVGLADFDRDGDLDALTTISGNAGTDSRIALWRNNGDGTFAPAQLFAAGPGPTGLVIGDFNADGFPDVVTADNGYVAGSNATISLLRHNGLTGAQAGFLAPQATVVGDNPMRVDAADIDGDGDLDLVVGRGDTTGGANGINVLTNNGSGGFTMVQSFLSVPGAYRNSYAVQLADVDRDGRLDLISGGAINSSSTYGVVAVRRNEGGTFGAPTLYALASWSFTPYDIKAADVDGDGWLDILATTPSGRAVDGWNLLTNDRTGRFGNAEFRHAAKWTYAVDAIDVDGDGDRDVVTVGHDSSVITVHPNRNGQFVVPTVYAIGTLSSGLEEGDLDRDGDLDLVAVGSSGGQILRNQGNGTFTVQQFSTPFVPSDMILRDMNNDGFLDLVLREYDFAVALNNRAGSFQAPVVTRVGATQAGEIGAFDLDGDGDLDIVATDPGPAARVYLFRNLGDGVTFAFVTSIGGAGLPFGVDGGDVDHDGDIDLMFDNALGMTLYFGNNDFTFAGPEPTGTPGYPFRLVDINADGDLDIVYQQPQDSFGTVFVGTMLGFGDGGFDRPRIIEGPNGLEAAFRISSDLDVRDVDGDGKPDVVLTNNAPNDLSIFLGNGDGTLRPHDRYGAGYAAGHTALGDFDRDGLVDAAVAISLPPSGISSGAVVLYGARPMTTVFPARFTVTRGAQTGGGLSALFFSDNSYVDVQARRATEIAAASVEIEVEGVAPTETPSSLKFTLEAGQSGDPVLQRIELFNFQSGLWEVVDERAAPFADTTINLSITTNAGRFVQPGTRLMRARIGYHDRGVTFISWGARYDVTKWEVGG